MVLKPKESADNFVATEMSSGDRVAMLKLLVQQRIFSSSDLCEVAESTEEKMGSDVIYNALREAASLMMLAPFRLARRNTVTVM